MSIIRDEVEFRDIVQGSLDDMTLLFGDRAHQLQRSTDCRADAVAAANLLCDGLETVPRNLHSRFRAFVGDVKRALRRKVMRFPRLGSINVFESRVIHAADDTGRKQQGNAGTLFVEIWKK